MLSQVIRVVAEKVADIDVFRLTDVLLNTGSAKIPAEAEAAAISSVTRHASNPRQFFRFLRIKTLLFI
jgi:hypothetical protein